MPSDSYDYFNREMNLTAEDIAAIARMMQAENVPSMGLPGAAMVVDAMLNRVAAPPYGVYGTLPGQLAKSTVPTTLEAVLDHWATNPETGRKTAQFTPIEKTPNWTNRELAPPTPPNQSWTNTYLGLREYGMPPMTANPVATHYYNSNITAPEWGPKLENPASVYGLGSAMHVTGTLPGEPRPAGPFGVNPDQNTVATRDIARPEWSLEQLEQVQDPVGLGLHPSMLTEAPEAITQAAIDAGTANIAPDTGLAPTFGASAGLGLRGPAAPFTEHYQDITQNAPSLWSGIGALPGMAIDAVKAPVESLFTMFSPREAPPAPPSAPPSVPALGMPSPPEAPMAIDEASRRVGQFAPQPPARDIEAFQGVPAPYGPPSIDAATLAGSPIGTPSLTNFDTRMGIPSVPSFAAPNINFAEFGTMALPGAFPEAPYTGTFTPTEIEPFGQPPTAPIGSLTEAIQRSMAQPIDPYGFEVNTNLAARAPMFDYDEFAQVPTDLAPRAPTLNTTMPEVMTRAPDYGAPPSPPGNPMSTFGAQMALNVEPADLLETTPSIGLTGTPTMGFPSFGPQAPAAPLAPMAMLDNAPMAAATSLPSFPGTNQSLLAEMQNYVETTPEEQGPELPAWEPRKAPPNLGAAAIQQLGLTPEIEDQLAADVIVAETPVPDLPAPPSFAAPAPPSLAPMSMTAGQNFGMADAQPNVAPQFGAQQDFSFPTTPAPVGTVEQTPLAAPPTSTAASLSAGTASAGMYNAGPASISAGLGGMYGTAPSPPASISAGLGGMYGAAPAPASPPGPEVASRFDIGMPTPPVAPAAPAVPALEAPDLPAAMDLAAAQQAALQATPQAAPASTIGPRGPSIAAPPGVPSLAEVAPMTPPATTITDAPPPSTQPTAAAPPAAVSVPDVAVAATPATPAPMTGSIPMGFADAAIIGAAPTGIPVGAALSAVTPGSLSVPGTPSFAAPTPEQIAAAMGPPAAETPAAEFAPMAPVAPSITAPPTPQAPQSPQASQTPQSPASPSQQPSTPTLGAPTGQLPGATQTPAQQGIAVESPEVQGPDIMDSLQRGYTPGQPTFPGGPIATNYAGDTQPLVGGPAAEFHGGLGGINMTGGIQNAALSGIGTQIGNTLGPMFGGPPSPPSDMSALGGAQALGGDTFGFGGTGMFGGFPGFSGPPGFDGPSTGDDEGSNMDNDADLSDPGGFGGPSFPGFSGPDLGGSYADPGGSWSGWGGGLGGLLGGPDDSDDHEYSGW